MPRTILVTGSAGFIGFHVSRTLLERGNRVIGVDNFNDYYDIALKEDRNKILERHKKYRVYHSDIRNKGPLEKVFVKEKIDIICHLAAQAGVRYSLEFPGEYVQSNIEGTVNVFEAARLHNIKDVIYASSSSVYGNNPVPWSEKQKTDEPINPYGASKRATELLAYTYHYLYKINMVGLRFFTVYGPWGRPDMAYFKFADKIVKGEPIDVYNKGRMKRDFTYVDDIVSGVLAALDKPQPYEIYNLGNSQSEKLGTLISLIEKGIGKKAKKRLLPMQAGDFLENFADITKAKQDLAFEPKTPLKVGMANFIEWYKDYYKI
ncbi:MAG: NAD-dependent epimerase/dehydratase family protein [Candidatus Komeilibacteria bacterium]|nr:NAD-dependent epimerase/dehydratase family protein [Candidatus Komeilibacteria bacterium]